MDQTLHPNQQLLLDRLFRPSETVKLTLSATLLRAKGSGATKAGDGVEVNRDLGPEEEQRVIVGVVVSGGSEGGAEEGEEEGA